MAAIPEMLAWYALLAAAVLGLKLSFRRHWRDLVLPMGFAAGWVVALALSEGNTGNIFRHRSMFMPFVFLLAAVGLLQLWDRWQASRAPRAQSLAGTGGDPPALGRAAPGTAGER